MPSLFSVTEERLEWIDPEGNETDFSWNRSAGKYEALYEKLTDFE